MYDVVIIGSGLGGLACGVMLGREGYSVCVLEKNRTIGGCLRTFRRGRHTFDTGIHYVGSLDEGQILNRYFKYLGVMPSLDVARMDAAGEGFDTVMLGDRGEAEYGLGMGYERFAGNLKGYFPTEAANIDRFCTLLKQVGGTMSVENLRRGIISDGAMQYLERPALDTIDGMFADPTLKSVLAGTSLLYGGINEKTTLYHYGMTNHSFIESAYRFVGGSQQLADALAAKIRENGGEIVTGTEVTAIKVQEGRVSGVEVNGGGFIGAGHVISDIHPAATFELVEKTPKIKKAYLTRLRSLENSCGVFTVWLALKKETLPYLDRNYYIHADGDTRRIEYDTAKETPVGFAPFAGWEGTTVEKRGAEYLDFKAHLAERIIDFTARRIPGLRNAIEHIYTASPLTWRDYTATPGGSAYGIVKDWRSPLATLIPVNTRFDNLLLTGQNINVHGVLGVTVTAALTCSRLLGEGGEEYIAKKISNA